MRTADMTLSGGRVVQLAMPDMYTILATNGRAPNPGMAAVLRLLDGVGALPETNLLQRQTAQAEFYRGLYEIAALCLQTPRLVLNGEEAGPDDITPRDLSFNDVQTIYYSFFRTDAPATRSGPDDAIISAISAGILAGGGTVDDVVAAAQRLIG